MDGGSKAVEEKVSVQKGNTSKDESSTINEIQEIGYDADTSHMANKDHRNVDIEMKEPEVAPPPQQYSARKARSRSKGRKKSKNRAEEKPIPVQQEDTDEDGKSIRKSSSTEIRALERGYEGRLCCHLHKQYNCS